MKKVVILSDESRAAFEAFLASLESMEGDKDRFLKAARLDRVEREPLLNGEQIMSILGGIGALVGIFLLLIVPLILMTS